MFASRFKLFQPRSVCTGMIGLGAAFLFVMGSNAAQQPVHGAADLWTRLDQAQPADVRRDRTGSAATRGVYQLDRRSLEAILSRAPVDGSRAGIEVTLPLPDGRRIPFMVSESPVMEEGLARKYPQLKTYAGHAVDDPALRVRLNLTPRGMHAMILGRGPHVFVDPSDTGPDEHLTYYKDAAAKDENGFECLAEDGSSGSLTSSAAAATEASGSVLRIARLALAATGEYTQYHGGTQEGALLAMVTAVNRLNAIYEAELALRLMLVANNDLIIFTNAATDPYSGNDAQAMLTQNQATIDTLVGNAHYDVGHVFSTGGGGLAQVAGACVTGWKARGVTGRASPMGDPFYVDYVAHELGHQFGAHHTFNGALGNCSAANRHAGTAYEPGSGSTIMAYSGLCAADNIQLTSDAYFHSASLVEIQSFLAAVGLTTQSLANTPPTVEASVSRVIPRSTPFLLTAQGEDADADTLSYCWEQLDLGPAALLSAPDTGNGPLFRSRPPQAEPVRWFPDRAALLSGNHVPGETLPQIGRLMDFRVTARDGQSSAMDSMQISVADGTGPFRVQEPAGGAVCSISCTILWEVAGTDQAPVSAATVEILLSTNGGWTFPIVLASSTPNDGSEVVPLPDAYSVDARIMVRATDNIFFNVSPGNFTLHPHAGPPQFVMVDTAVSNPAVLMIPAVNTSGNSSVYPASIVVDEPTGVIEEVAVVLHGLSHGWTPDLDILLVPPVGSAVMLLSDVSSTTTITNAELRFSDAGNAMPSGGLPGSGHFLPMNVGTSGDGFPVPEPYAVAFAGLKGLSPTGTWSLYVRDDAKGDTGALTGGWSLELRVRRPFQPNQPPSLATESVRYVHEGATLHVLPEASDPDGGETELTFAVTAAQPEGVELDPSTGRLTWRPAPGSAGLTNELVFSVTDGGTPALTTTSVLQAVVVPSVTVRIQPSTDGLVDLFWNAVPGASYVVESATDLTGTWEPMGELVNTAGFEGGLVGMPTGGPNRFFRVKVSE